MIKVNRKAIKAALLERGVQGSFDVDLVFDIEVRGSFVVKDADEALWIAHQLDDILDEMYPDPDLRFLLHHNELLTVPTPFGTVEVFTLSAIPYYGTMATN